MQTYYRHNTYNGFYPDSEYWKPQYANLYDDNIDNLQQHLEMADDYYLGQYKKNPPILNNMPQPYYDPVLIPRTVTSLDTGLGQNNLIGLYQVDSTDGKIPPVIVPQDKYKLAYQQYLLQQQATMLVSYNQGNIPVTPYQDLMLYSGFTPTQKAPLIKTHFNNLTGDKTPPHYHGFSPYLMEHYHFGEPIYVKPAPTIAKPISVKSGARIWGDPHFVGADSDMYDIQGKANGIYNILSDKGIQLNAQFTNQNGLTSVSSAAIMHDDHKIQINANKNLTIDGADIKDNGTYLNGMVTKTDQNITVKTPEYRLTFLPQGNELEIGFQSYNVFADNVMPHGLWGQTADGNGLPRTGDKGHDAQGGGAIEGLNGIITQKGDKDTAELYRLNDIFDTDFTNFNQFNG